MPRTPLGLLVSRLASQPSAWLVTLAGDVLGLNTAELGRRLGSIDPEPDVLTHLTAAAERGIVQGHAERQARTHNDKQKIH
jgi:hypothetical protein